MAATDEQGTTAGYKKMLSYQENTQDHDVVSVRLAVISPSESHPTRYLTLTGPDYSITIGRGSRSSGEELCPGQHNAWFESRVMSRNHAILKACPNKKTVTIEDIGSMHGTLVDGVKLGGRRPHALKDCSTIVFGTEISRGEETFYPLKVISTCTFARTERSLPPGEYEADNLIGGVSVGIGRNTFSVPDYDSEEYDSEPLLLMDNLKAEVCDPKKHPVPQSDLVDIDSFASEAEDDDPAVMDCFQTYCNTFHTSKVDLHDANNISKTKPADLVMWSNDESATLDSKTTSQVNIAVKSTPPAKAFTFDRCVMDDEYDESEEYGDNLSSDVSAENSIYDEYQGAGKRPDTSSLSSQSPIMTSAQPNTGFIAYVSPQEQVTSVVTKPTASSILEIAKPRRSPNVTAARAPSPSDAAMVKGVPGTTCHVAELQTSRSKLTGLLTSFPLPTPHAFNEAIVHELAEKSLEDCKPSDGNTLPELRCRPPASPHNPPFAMTTPSQMCALPVYSSTTQSLVQNHNKSWGPENDPWQATEFTTKCAGIDPSPSNPVQTLKATARVAIKDLVEDTVPTDYKESTKSAFDADDVGPVPGTKRKADLISNLDESTAVFVDDEDYDIARGVEPAEEVNSLLEQDAQIVKTLVSTTSNESQELLEPMMIIEDTPPGSSRALEGYGIDVEEERPKKKAKSNFYKFAATAAGGIAVGAVSVVAALVSLPPDFFV